jgi:hypothetical protein
VHSLFRGQRESPPPPQNASINFILNEGKPLKLKVAERLQQVARVLQDRQQTGRWVGVRACVRVFGGQGQAAANWQSS